QAGRCHVLSRRLRSSLFRSLGRTPALRRICPHEPPYSVMEWIVFFRNRIHEAFLGRSVRTNFSFKPDSFLRGMARIPGIVTSTCHDHTSDSCFGNREQVAES